MIFHQPILLRVPNELYNGDGEVGEAEWGDQVCWFFPFGRPIHPSGNPFGRCATPITGAACYYSFPETIPLFDCLLILQEDSRWKLAQFTSDVVLGCTVVQCNKMGSVSNEATLIKNHQSIQINPERVPIFHAFRRQWNGAIRGGVEALGATERRKVISERSFSGCFTISN